MRRTGIDLFRYSVTLFDHCNESFNRSFSGVELLKIADACQQSKWDIYPDQWEERQIQEAITQSKIPNWTEVEGKLIPVYDSEENDDYFAIVWAGSSLYYICDSEKMVQERLHLILNDPHLNRHIRILVPAKEYKGGKEVTP